MSYLNCPRCGLSLAVRGEHPASELCPRCHGRAGVSVPMYRTDSERPPAADSAEVHAPPGAATAA